MSALAEKVQVLSLRLGAWLLTTYVYVCLIKMTQFEESENSYFGVTTIIIFVYKSTNITDECQQIKFMQFIYGLFQLLAVTYMYT